MLRQLFIALITATAINATAQDLQLNEQEYFERQGVNVLVFSNSFNGGFNDEKNSGIEIIHHGVRTVQGGAVRLNNTPEQWDLVPTMTYRKVDRDNQRIEVGRGGLPIRTLNTKPSTLNLIIFAEVNFISYLCRRNHHLYSD